MEVGWGVSPVGKQQEQRHRVNSGTGGWGGWGGKEVGPVGWEWVRGQAEGAREILAGPWRA